MADSTGTETSELVEALSRIEALLGAQLALELRAHQHEEDYDKIERQTISYLNGEGLSQADISRALAIPKSTVSRRINQE